MSSDIWNPWHGCRKYSEGCDHCYMYYLDNERGKSGGEIYKVKTNSDFSVSKIGIYRLVPFLSKFFFNAISVGRIDPIKGIS